MKTTHFTNFGVQRQPPMADADGYLLYRPSVVERLKAGEDAQGATRSERWIAEQEMRIEAWQQRG